ncbi:DUF4388 domain-containing protein [Myxococcota bacterium]|nr:DUF4388 domain-containing protein [Myxococcota bacterium]
MSLVGNLEDLSLGDLLQIVSLSQKSGVLLLGSSSGSGQIVFRSGLVHAAGIKGRTPDLRSLLSEAGLLDGARFDALENEIGRPAAVRPELVIERAGLDPDRVESAIRKTAEAAIFEMFAWASGEFSFDGLREGAADAPYACLRGGINAQYLAMEGMRLRDEQGRDGSAPPPGTPPAELEDELFFGAEPLEIDGDDELELDAVWEGDSPSAPLAAAPLVDAPASESSASVAPAAAADVVAERVVSLADLEEPVEPETAAPAPVARTAQAAGPARPVVVIDPDAAVLEWVKASLEGRFARIHVFQRATEGLARIRQYLIRGEVPIVLIAPATPIDPLSGIHGLPDFVKRLRTQSARIVVVGLRDAGEGRATAVPAHLDAVVLRPSREKLRPGAAAESAPIRERLLGELAAALERSENQAGTPKSGAAPAASAPLGVRVSEGEAALAAARSQNDVLAILLDVAASGFARAAVLALRDGEAFPIAGRGIEALEIDPLATSPRLACPIPDTSLLHRVLDSRRSTTGTLQSQADRLLVAMFGPIEPKTAYLAPIVGPAGVVAVLYADQGGHRRPIPDTSAFERLIARAGEKLRGLAVERAKGEAAAGSR